MLNSVAIIVGLAVLATLALAVAVAKTFRKAGPNQAIIVYGFRKARVIKAGAAVINRRRAKGRAKVSVSAGFRD